MPAHYCGMLYYASPVRLNRLTTAKQWKSLNSLHFHALRTGRRDYQFQWNKQSSNRHFNRATPLQWMMYNCSKLAKTLYQLGDAGPPMSTELRWASYINDRKPRSPHSWIHQDYKLVRHSFYNRLISTKNVHFDWINGIDINRLRIELKKTFIKWTFLDHLLFLSYFIYWNDWYWNAVIVIWIYFIILYFF